jgi:hypothetical protein
MIPLFSRYALTRAQAEERLKRELRGDPSRGERAALQALAVLDFDRVRSLLSSKDVGDDFRNLVRERLEAAVRRDDKHFVVSVMVSGNAYDHYARHARLRGHDISASLAAAVERDFASAREQGRIEAEPVTAELTRYVRELVAVLTSPANDPHLSAHLATLQTLAARLADRTMTADPGAPS